MSKRQVEVRLAIREINRHPYYSTRVLGPRAMPEKNEFVVPLTLSVDSAWFAQRTPRVYVEIEAPKAPEVTVGAA